MLQEFDKYEREKLEIGGYCSDESRVIRSQGHVRITKLQNFVTGCIVRGKHPAIIPAEWLTGSFVRTCKKQKVKDYKDWKSNKGVRRIIYQSLQDFNVFSLEVC